MDVQILASTVAGEIAEGERATVELFGLTRDLQSRETARVAVIPLTGSGRRATAADYVHLDIYPAGRTAQGTVVFVGGLSAHALGYAGYQAQLAGRGWNVVAVDLRGHGRSSGKPGEFTAEMAIDDLNTAVEFAREHFALPVGIMGTSLGGFYALLGSNAIPAIDCAVCHWIFLPDMPVTKKDARAMRMALILQRIAPWAKLDTRKVAEWGAVCTDPALRDKIMADPMMVWKYSVKALTSSAQYTPAQALTDLRCPTLVLIGEKDGMTPLDYTTRVFERLTGAPKQLHVVPGAGHMGGLIENRDEMVIAADLWFGQHLDVERVLAPSDPALKL